MLPHYQARKPWISWRIRWRRKNDIKFWCHIVWIQGDLRKICQICVQLNKQTNKMNEMSSDRKPNSKRKKFEICIKSVYRRYERRRERKEKNHVISVNLSDFQQIQVQEKWIKNRPNQRGEIRHLSFEYKGKGKERIGERYRQKEEKFENLRDFQQIQVKFYQLFATVIRWSLWKFEKKWQKSSLVWLT